MGDLFSLGHYKDEAKEQRFNDSLKKVKPRP
jgi:hypothetical protein